MQQANGTNTKKEKKWQSRSGKKDSLEDILTIAGKIPQKIKRQNPDKMCQLIFLKIYPQQQKQ